MNIKLDYSKPTKNGIFYRYFIDDAVVWFEQESRGCIFSIGIQPPKNIPDVEFIVDDDYRHDVFYPVNFRIRGTSHLKASEIDNYIEKLNLVKKFGEAVMSIFELPVHKDLYEKHFRKDNADE